MADCYANENFPLPVVEALRELGHNLLTTYESGKAGQAISVVSHFQIFSSHQPFPLSLALPRGGGRDPDWGISPSPLVGEGRGEGETGAAPPNVQSV